MSAGLTIAIALLALIVLGAALVTRASGKRSPPPHGGDAGGGEFPRVAGPAMKMRPTLVRAMPAVTEAEVSDRKPRFPAVSLLLLSAALIALFVIAGWARSHCAFGFGGFGCTGVFVGRGEMLVAATLALTAAVVALIPVSGWRLFRWWRGRQA